MKSFLDIFSHCKFIKANGLWVSAVLLVRLLFHMKTTLATKCSVSPSTIVIRYIQVIQRQLLDAVGSSHSLSVLLSAMETSNTTQTALALARWPIIRNYSNSYGCAEYSSHSYYSKMGFILLRASDCVATIWGWRLFEGGIYLKKYSIYPIILIVTSLLFPLL